MPAPTSPVLDDFNALPNFLLTDRDGWDASPLWPSDNSLITNPSPTCALRSGSGSGSNRWPMAGIVDQECWLTYGATTNSGNVRVYTRLIPADVNVNGYELAVAPSGAVNLLLRVFGSGTAVLGAWSCPSRNDGDSIALSSIGSVHTGWYRVNGATSWTSMGSAMDTTYPDAGDIGLQINSPSGTAIDTFGGGGTAGVDGSYAPRRGGSRR